MTKKHPLFTQQHWVCHLSGRAECRRELILHSAVNMNMATEYYTKAACLFLKSRGLCTRYLKMNFCSSFYFDFISQNSASWNMHCHSTTLCSASFWMLLTQKIKVQTPFVAARKRWLWAMKKYRRKWKRLIHQTCQLMTKKKMKKGSRHQVEEDSDGILYIATEYLFYALILLDLIYLQRKWINIKKFRKRKSPFFI